MAEQKTGKPEAVEEQLPQDIGVPAAKQESVQAILNINTDGSPNVLDGEDDDPSTFGDDSIDTNSSKQGPGRLRSDLGVQFHTRKAFKLVRGAKVQVENKKTGEVRTHDAPGLIQFDRALSRVIRSAALGDPWADQVLVAIEEETRQLTEINRNKIKRFGSQLDGKLKDLNASVTKAISDRPAGLTINFFNPFSYKLLWAVCELDKLCSLVMLLKHYAIMDSKNANVIITESTKSIRRVINKALRFKQTGVSREDLAYRNQRFREAAETNAKIELTPEVILAERRAEFAPDFQTGPKDTVSPEIREKLEELIAELSDPLDTAEDVD